MGHHQAVRCTVRPEPDERNPISCRSLQQQSEELFVETVGGEVDRAGETGWRASREIDLLQLTPDRDRRDSRSGSTLANHRWPQTVPVHERRPDGSVRGEMSMTSEKLKGSKRSRPDPATACDLEPARILHARRHARPASPVADVRRAELKKACGVRGRIDRRGNPVQESLRQAEVIAQRAVTRVCDRAGHAQS